MSAVAFIAALWINIENGRLKTLSFCFLLKRQFAFALTVISKQQTAFLSILSWSSSAYICEIRDAVITDYLIEYHAEVLSVFKWYVNGGHKLF